MLIIIIILATSSYYDTAGVKILKKTCRKSAARMDDVLPELIIKGVLGIDITEINGFKTQLSSKIHTNSQNMRKQAEVVII